MPTMQAVGAEPRQYEQGQSLDSLPTMLACDGTPAVLGRIDQYELVRKLGGGGFGVVYLVRDTMSGMEFAIKTLHPLLKTNAEEMARVRSNFVLTAKLSHPNIAAAHVLHRAMDVKYADEETKRELRVFGGDPVMVMTYAPGVTLSSWRRQFAGGRVPFEKALDILSQIASALDYAHGEHVVHRDVKPQNVMIETEPATGNIRARVLDFGLAAEIRSSMSRVSQEGGDTSGTRPYMASEQWSGKHQDGRTDQYALACIAYELLSGAVPFAGAFETGDAVIMSNAVMNMAPEPIDGLSANVNAALMKALSKDRAQRFANCGEFIGAIRKVIVAPASVPRRRSRRAGAWIAAAFVALSAAVAIPVMVGRDKSVDGIKASVEVAAPTDMEPQSDAETAEVTGSMPPGEPAPAAEPIALAIEAEPAPQPTDVIAEQSAAEEPDLDEIDAAARDAKSAAAPEKLKEEDSKSAATRLEKRERERKEGEVAQAKEAARESLSNVERLRAGADHEFSRRFKDADSAMAELEKLFAAEDLENANTLKNRVRDDTEWISANMEARDAVRGKEKEISGLAAKAGEAKELSQAEIAKAEAAVKAKDASLDESDFTGAEAKADEAIKFYKAAIGEANRARCASKVNAARKFAEAEAWEDSLDAADEALKFVANDPEAQELKRDAEDHLRPMAVVSAKVGGSEVPVAKPRLDGKEAVAGDTNTLTVNGVRFDLVWVAPGSFDMGANDSDAKKDEKPVHKVTLTKGYWIGKTEVTQKQWEAVMGDNPSNWNGDDFPVKNVSWYDCQKFIEKLNGLQGEVKFALPTEAQWEFAARGGTKGKGCKYSGSYNVGEVAWYFGNSGGEAHHVGTKAANELGIHDMSGNVWEWCQDWYGNYPDDSVEDPSGAGSGVFRVSRGGSWNYAVDGCRPACRLKYTPDGQNHHQGFRLAASAGQ